MRGTSTKLAGHTLPREGRISNGIQYVSAIEAKAVCSCGEESSELYHNAEQRKRWHRRHKEDIRGHG